MENVGSISVLEIKNDPSPSIYPSNQLLVIIILWFVGIIVLVRLVFILFFNSNNLFANFSASFNQTLKVVYFFLDIS